MNTDDVMNTDVGRVTVPDDSQDTDLPLVARVSTPVHAYRGGSGEPRYERLSLDSPCPTPVIFICVHLQILLLLPLTSCLLPPSALRSLDPARCARPHAPGSQSP